jgi:hypothetical protein
MDIIRFLTPHPMRADTDEEEVRHESKEQRLDRVTREGHMADTASTP